MQWDEMRWDGTGSDAMVWTNYISDRSRSIYVQIR